MSFGKIVRKIVKKWLKKDDDEPGTLEPIAYDEPYEERSTTLHPSSDPCVFCVERGGGPCSGDLNRNTHISDEMRFSGDGEYRKCLGDDVEYDVLDSSEFRSSPFHGTTPFVDDSTEFSFDPPPSCRSSRSPVPVCVCEACYILVSSNQTPSTISASSRTAATPGAAAAAAGQPFADDDDDDSECCPYRSHIDVNSKLVFGKFMKSGIVTNEMEDTGCNKDSSISLTSNARQIHSASSDRRIGGNAEQLETICPNPDDLPVSVPVSLDGEEGFVEGQRHLHSRNRWYDPRQTRFRPPPNKTICHVAKSRNKIIS